MMDYELLHNEARPRPRRRPRRRRNTLREVCWVTVAALLLAAAPSGLPPHCPRQAGSGSARPFKARFSELKVSNEEAPASSAILLVFR